MSRFIETIKIVEGKPRNLFHHSKRFNSTRSVFFPAAPALDLQEWIHIPAQGKSGVIKCRVTYSDIIENIEFEPYAPSIIRSLRIVEDNHIEYSFKYKNRNRLSYLFEQRQNNDDVMIVKKGRITDSSFSNLIFLRDKSWYTPLHPLLPGTKREYLLGRNMIRSEEIFIDHLFQFEKVALINAMLDPGDCVIDIQQIRGI